MTVKKFTVVAQVRFDIYDEDEFLATRQARYNILNLVGDSNAEDYRSEYPNLEQPFVYADDFKILDEEGKVVLDQLVPVEEEDEPKAD
jgi:hypothetical protein